MTIDISVAWIVTVMLVTIRLGVMVFATPMDAIGRLPALIRVLFSMAAGVLFVNLLKLTLVVVSIASIWVLIVMALGEVVVGLCLVMGMHAALGSFMLAGKIMDSQSGFGAAGIFNPGTQSQDPLFGSILTLMAVMAFFALGFQYYFVKGFAYSLLIVPPGSVPNSYNLLLTLKQISNMFVYGVMLAAPVVFVLLLVDVGVGIVSRTMPQMNVYFSILPLKIFLSLCIFALSIKYMQPLFEHIFAGVFEYWQQSITHMIKT